eukprot:snap_masked-scaffold_22-processed-gene-5.23-mRNA-1 protein AED:1.00 eAED:1.00 QI:0/0/0/0/1/1/2/0/67
MQDKLLKIDHKVPYSVWLRVKETRSLLRKLDYLNMARNHKHLMKKNVHIAKSFFCGITGKKYLFSND